MVHRGLLYALPFDMIGPYRFPIFCYIPPDGKPRNNGSTPRIFLI